MMAMVTQWALMSLMHTISSFPPSSLDLPTFYMVIFMPTIGCETHLVHHACNAYFFG